MHPALLGHRGLLFLVGAWTLQGWTRGFVAGLAPRRQPTPTRVEIHSSGAVSQVGAVGASSEDEVWPKAAVAKDEVELGMLKGGTRPMKVKIGSNMFVRKKVLEGDSQAIMMEALANELYRAAQVKSESCRYYPAVAAPADTVKKPTAYMLCRFIDGLQPVMSFTAEVKQVISKNFVLDAAFGNYDVGHEWGQPPQIP